MMMLAFLMMFANEFRDAEVQWRQEHEASMREDDSWLNLVGLFWLQQGENSFGSSDMAHIVLPKHSTVNLAGAFQLKEGQVHYEMSRAQRATVFSGGEGEGQLQNKGTLTVGDVMHHNHLRMFLIERDGRLALRARDLRSKDFVNFEKLEFYRPKKKYVIEADYVPYEEHDTIAITTVINTEIILKVPGVLRFELDGKQVELLPTLESEEDNKLFVMFKDQTSGSSTYAGGRFLYAEMPDGPAKVTLNFNRAFNPPCAYTDYATCPLPPAENWLDIAIEAGERTYVRPYIEE